MARRSLVIAVVILVAGFVTVSRASSTTSTAPISAPCDAASVSAPFHGPLTITRVLAYGCQDGWGYLWANAGTGAQEVSVTELVRYSTTQQGWQVADRGIYCTGSLLPTDIQTNACNSN